jgi:hypothetical protein
MTTYTLTLRVTLAGAEFGHRSAVPVGRKLVLLTG